MQPFPDDQSIPLHPSDRAMPSWNNAGSDSTDRVEWDLGENAEQLKSSFVKHSNVASRLSINIAAGREQLTSAFELIYQSYLKRRYIEPHPGRIVYRSVYGHESSRTILAVQDDDQVVGSVTVAGGDGVDLPMETTFLEEVRSLRQANRSVAEFCGLAIDRTMTQSSLSVMFGITQFAIQFACWRCFDDALFIIHPRHRIFYQRCFDVTMLGPCRPHPLAGWHPAIACRIDLQALHRLPLFPIYFGAKIPAVRFLEPPIHPDDHQYFCQRAGISVTGESLEEVEMMRKPRAA